ncbi:MAG: anthranilate phosphoribosyltransferase [Planctomycetaceae bacterium]|nr:anthranilate phosphoribosyltransferase [Planctomycetaceae bacterium]
MIDELANAIDRILAGEDASTAQAHAAFAALMDGRASETAIASLLTALRMKGESVAEIVGAASAMRERVTRIPSQRSGLLDTCGTGGAGLQTFNVSTATALVAAAAGVPVAKHGNRSATSTSGSADVLEELGVNVQISPDQVAECLDQLGIGFCFARALHGAMRHAAPVRAELGFRTVFNLLGPLTNPASAQFQIIGTVRAEIARKLAFAMAKLGTQRAFVVCGADQLDEVALWGETSVFEVSEGRVTEHTWTHESFDLAECTADELRVDAPAQSAEMIRQVFSGAPGPARDMILANSAAALVVSGNCDDLRAGVALAREAIDSGAAENLCRRMAELTASFA